jgi:AbrB family looped-hinge helix DNA binding protein
VGAADRLAHRGGDQQHGQPEVRDRHRDRAGPVASAGQRCSSPCRTASVARAMPPTDFVGFEWYAFPMEAVVDQAGRIVLPKYIRDALGLLPGTKVDISPYGAGVQVVPAGRTARLVEEDGVLVSSGETPVDDDILFGLVDAVRK